MDRKRETVQHVFAQLLEEDRGRPYKGKDKYRHVLSAAIFDRLVEENKDNLTRRPTDANRVAYSEAGLARLKRICEENRLHETFLRGDFPDLIHFYRAFERARTYVPFERLCDDLVTLTDRAVKDLRRLGLEQTLVMLALPDSTVYKSSIWFDAHVWKASHLVDVVDLIIPGAPALQRVVDALATVVASPFTRIIVLYVDDMAYSGSQLFDFTNALSHIARPGTLPVDVWPLVAYMSDAVPSNMLQFSGPDERVPVAQRMTTPVRTLRYWLRHFEISPKEYRTEVAGLDDNFGLTDTKDMFLRDLYVTFVEALDFPVIVFEHKLADDASLAIDLFKQEKAFPGESSTLLQRQLVAIGTGQRVSGKGSEAFYRNLVWTYKQDELSDTGRLKLLYSYALRAPITCFACAKPAHLVCSQCQVATYCGEECQRDHFEKGFHSIMCQPKK